MCGIAGYVNFDFAEPDPELLHKMLDTMVLRGPDGRDIFINYNTGIGHTRLSVIDLETGGQPICNEDATLWVVCNGEIFNYRDLRRMLLERGHQFRTQSDTEVILHLYEECGSAFLQHLDGFFADRGSRFGQRGVRFPQHALGILHVKILQELFGRGARPFPEHAL